MKHTRKLTALLLAMVLAIGFAVPVFAEVPGDELPVEDEPPVERTFLDKLFSTFFVALAMAGATIALSWGALLPISPIVFLFGLAFGILMFWF